MHAPSCAASRGPHRYAHGRIPAGEPAEASCHIGCCPLNRSTARPAEACCLLAGALVSVRPRQRNRGRIPPNQLPAGRSVRAAALQPPPDADPSVGPVTAAALNPRGHHLPSPTVRRSRHGRHPAPRRYMQRTGCASNNLVGVNQSTCDQAVQHILAGATWCNGRPGPPQPRQRRGVIDPAVCGASEPEECTPLNFDETLLRERYAAAERLANETLAARKAARASHRRRPHTSTAPKQSGQAWAKQFGAKGTAHGRPRGGTHSG